MEPMQAVVAEVEMLDRAASEETVAPGEATATGEQEKVTIAVEVPDDASPEEIAALIAELESDGAVVTRDSEPTFKTIEELEAFQEVESRGLEVAIEAIPGGTMLLYPSSSSAESYAKLEIAWRRKKGKMDFKRPIPDSLSREFMRHAMFGTVVGSMKIPSASGVLPWDRATYDRVTKPRVNREGKQIPSRVYDQIARDASRLGELISKRREADSGN